MRIFDIVRHLLPVGTVPGSSGRISPSYQSCPTWPPDVFAVVGTILDRSGCYTMASPDRTDLPGHEARLDRIDAITKSWVKLSKVSDDVQALWLELVTNHAEVPLEAIKDNPSALTTLLLLFAVADEACHGMGWDEVNGEPFSEFARAVLSIATNALAGEQVFLPDWPTSLGYMVSAEHVVVLPKSITTDKGCTIRSLSHNLALLPCRTVLDAEWRLVSPKGMPGPDSALRLLLIPFPYEIPTGSFKLTSKRTKLKNNSYHAAFFGLEQKWLSAGSNNKITGAQLADTLVIPLIEEAKAAAGGSAPHGVVLPECALDDVTAIDLVKALAGSGIQFLITGILERDEATGRSLNQAYTFFLESKVARAQNKHHRWRVDQNQANSYALGPSFDLDPDNQQWWEDIDVNKRGLPFYAIRKDTSMVTLICEDLARMDPAMNAIRAVGPNLVVALLMDGPQLGPRWPGRYSGVLADEPGCSVLTLTCAATVDSSNTHFIKTAKPKTPPQRVIARWTQTENVSHDIIMPDGTNGVLLCLRSDPKHQTTLDNRSDSNRSRQLKFVAQHALRGGTRPEYIP